uniref:Uncharacterized protein n=1 Tax=Anguilla anguilla TaxID=7936 RepID=A0A0E9RK81_ANGAN
MTGMRADMDKG